MRHEVVIVGGGTAGITVAARLRRAGVTDVAVVEPSEHHYCQPLWTLVGGGLADAASTVRPEARVLPVGVTWIRDRAVQVHPDARTVDLDDGRRLSYEHLVVAPGLRLDFDGVPGLAEAVGHDGVSSNYRFDLAPRTWEFIRQVRGGTAVFTMPPGPIKCAGAPQKIAYLAADWWRRQGALDRMRVILVLPTAAMFSQPDWGEVLKGVAAGYGIEVRHDTHLVEVDGPARRAVLLDTKGGTKEDIDFEVLHAVPPQSAPDWVKASPLAGATAALAPGGTLLVVGDDRANLTSGVGGPQDAAVLYTPEQIVAGLDGLRVDRADTVRRPVPADGRTAEALDTVVVAVRP